MNKKLLFSLLLAGTAFTGHADEARLLRFPATNGSDIVFSYAGDLYKAPLNGGEAQKLTSHIGYEMFARFSPDGKSIAFTGQYDGNTQNTFKIINHFHQPLFQMNVRLPIQLFFCQSNIRPALTRVIMR